jgi:predicted GTPase
VIVGRPNVGKSALFNRLVRRRQALVRDTPAGHVTRDYQQGPAQLADLQFTAVDTSGLEPEASSRSGGGAGAGGPRQAAIQERTAAITARVLARAHVALFLFDGRCAAAGLQRASALAAWAEDMQPRLGWA